MKINNTLTKIIFTLTLVLLLGIFNIRAEENLSPGLFSTSGIDERVTILNNTPTVRSHVVKVNFDQLCQLESAVGLQNISTISYPLYLNLFDDVYLKVLIDRVEKTFSGGTSFVGHIEGVPLGEVIMVKNEGILSANINTGEHLYQVRYIDGDLHNILEVDYKGFPPELPPIPVDLESGNEADEISGLSLDTGNYIDIMVVYTAEARTAAGGTTAMKSLIDLAVAETNAGYSNSAVTQRLRLVHTAEVSYNETGFDWNTTLDRLKGTSDGYMDNVHTLRNTYGADEVSLIVSNSETNCGIGYVMDTLSTSFAPYAFTVVSIECATGYYSLAHEFGHNMGSHHDRANAGSQGVYNYSYGYQDPEGDFRTIMAYDCPSHCPRVNYWSNPDKTYADKLMGVIYTDLLAADNHKSLNNTLGTVRNFKQSKISSSPKISLNRNQFYFGAIRNGTKTGGQKLLISNGGWGTLTWSIKSNAAWLSGSPTSGKGAGVITLNVNPTSLAVGVYTGTITITASGAANSPQTVSVSLTVKNSSSDQLPFGDFATPINGSSVSSSVPVTGWVLDDIGVSSVKIYNGSTYIGDAVFVEGARPDVVSAYPSYPQNYQAGWGYMLLTYFLPGGGNGTYTLYAKVTDSAGHVVTLGAKTVHCNNAHAVKPFGAIDTPAQGGTASGSNYVNAGWALTPQPNKIPTNGSAVEVYIDSVKIKKGMATYGQYRSDIATLFPGYANTYGAAASFKFSTTVYPNGIHSIFWIVRDNGGKAEGIGSRFFIVQNNGADMDTDTDLPIVESASLNTNWNGLVKVTKGYQKNAAPQTVYPGSDGNINIVIHELERVVIDFGARVQPLKSLPIGSTLDQAKGIFYWNPGPGFIGNYELIFTDKLENSSRQINIKILPKN